MGEEFFIREFGESFRNAGAEEEAAAAEARLRRHFLERRAGRTNSDDFLNGLRGRDSNPTNLEKFLNGITTDVQFQNEILRNGGQQTEDVITIDELQTFFTNRDSISNEKSDILDRSFGVAAKKGELISKTLNSKEIDAELQDKIIDKLKNPVNVDYPIKTDKKDIIVTKKEGDPLSHIIKIKEGGMEETILFDKLGYTIPRDGTLMGDLTQEEYEVLLQKNFENSQMSSKYIFHSCQISRCLELAAN